MPELPEVQTTVNGLNKTVTGFTIGDAWSDLPKKNHARKDEIKNLVFWNSFKEKIVGAKIVKAERRGKNILIHLNNELTILIHMKMTGHLLFGKYRVGKKEDGEENHNWMWWPEKQKISPRSVQQIYPFFDNFYKRKEFGFL